MVSAVFSLSLYARVPESLNGIWEGTDRYIFFTDGTDEKNTDVSYVTILLKTFYGWYLDRAAEPQSYSSERRTLNDTTSENALHIRIEFIPLTKKISSDSGAWNLKIEYSKDNVVFIPVAVIDKKLYLNFLLNEDGLPVQANTSDTSHVNDNSVSSSDSGTAGTSASGRTEEMKKGFWQGVRSTAGIRISSSYQENEFSSYYVTEDNIYKIRYWKTDMPFSNDSADFTDEEKDYKVPKHILAAQTVFTCVPGQGHVIRNVDKAPAFPDIILDSSGLICTNKASYLSLRITPAELDDYISIVETQNAKKKPLPSPPFPPSDLDWHLKEIYYLEKNNKLIQIVRQHQKDFAEKYQNQQ